MSRIPEGELDSTEAVLAYGRQVSAFNRAVRGRAGQRALRMLRDALLALPEKKLCDEVLSDGTNVCALGALCAYEHGKANNLGWAEATAEFDAVDSEGWIADYVRDRFGMAVALSRDIMWNNDQGGFSWDYENDRPIPHEQWPEERYRQMLAYVESLIIDEQPS